MPEITLETLGQTLRAQRGPRGIRAVAEEIGISTATLSRIENGHLPDLGTFKLICGWLGADPSALLGFQNAAPSPMPRAHFKKRKTQAPKTLKAMAEMIAAAQIALEADRAS